MSQIEVERFLGRLITDDYFRTMASGSLEKTLFKEGIVLSKEEISILSRIEFSQYTHVAQSLDDAIKRS